MSTAREEQGIVQRLGSFQRMKLALHRKDRIAWYLWGTDRFYVDRLHQEERELEDAIARGASIEEVWREAADVANFAAMAADRYERRACHDR